MKHDHKTVALRIAESYMISSSSDIAGSVQDYLSDQASEITFDQFRQICSQVSHKVNIMIPTIQQMRMRHTGLIEYLDSLKIDLTEEYL